LFQGQISSLRKNLISELKSDKENLMNTVQQRTQDSALQDSRSLEAEIKNFKEGFHGVETNPKLLLETFKSIQDGSLFDEIESSQANVAEMALLWKNKDLFYNAMENPSTTPGTRKFMENLQNSKARPVTGRDTLRSPMAFDPNAFMNSDDMVVKTSGN
jgi:hypothetical protein